MGFRGTCWATALELVHFAKWQARLYQHEYHEHVWTSWTIFVHISQIWEAQMYWQRGVFRFLILGEIAAKPWKPGFDPLGCQLQPTTCTPLAVALARMRRWNSEHCPEGWCRRRRPCDSILHVPDDGFRFWGTPPFLHLFEQCCVVLSASPNWSHGSPKKILGSRPSATLMSWNKYVSHQMRCSEVSVSKVLLTSCRFWASFRAWSGIQLHEMLTHAYSNSPLTVGKNVFIRSWMNFMNCEWQSHLPQFKLDRSVWLSCTSIERQKHTQDSCADLPGSVWFSRFRRATARKYNNLIQFVAWEKNHKQHLRPGVVGVKVYLWLQIGLLAGWYTLKLP